MNEDALKIHQIGCIPLRLNYLSICNSNHNSFKSLTLIEHTASVGGRGTLFVNTIQSNYYMYLELLLKSLNHRIIHLEFIQLRYIYKN